MTMAQQLRKISRIQLFSTLGVGAGIVLGIVVLNGVFDSTLSVVLGVVAGVALVAGIGGFLHAQKLVDDVEEGIHHRGFELRTALMTAAQEAKNTEVTAQNLMKPPTTEVKE